MCYCSSHHGLLVTLCFSHFLPGISRPCAGISLPSHLFVSALYMTVCSTTCYHAMTLNFDPSKLLLLFFYLYCYSEKQLIPITSKCFQGILSLKDHHKSLVWFKSIWKLFDFGDISVKVSPHRCPMESSRCFGV